MKRSTLIKTGVLVLLLAAAIATALTLGPPDIDAVRARVEEAGLWGPALFFAVYVGLSLIPCPKALLTAAGGTLFGLVGGAGLSVTAALLGAIISFGLGRLLGRETVDRLIRGRLARVDELLSKNGLSAVLVVRLVPLVPFIAINYAGGLSGVKFRHFVLGSAIGMVPGSLAYSALGAYGTNPLGLALAGSALVILIIGGSYWARRINRKNPDTTGADGEGGAAHA